MLLALIYERFSLALISRSRSRSAGGRNPALSLPVPERVENLQPGDPDKIMFVPGHENCIKREGRCRDHRVGKGDIHRCPQLDGLFRKGDGEGKSPGAVKETSGLDKTVRIMPFPAQELDPRDDGYGERAFKNRIDNPFLIGSECPRKIINKNIRIDKKSGHARFHSFRRDSDTPFGSLMMSR